MRQSSLLATLAQVYPRHPGSICGLTSLQRAVSSSESPNWTVKPYIVQTLLPLVSPALFAASIYMILERVILLTNGEQHSVISRRWLTKLFVVGDVVSFVLQGAGKSPTPTPSA